MSCAHAQWVIAIVGLWSFSCMTSYRFWPDPARLRTRHVESAYWQSWRPDVVGVPNHFSKTITNQATHTTNAKSCYGLPGKGVEDSLQLYSFTSSSDENDSDEFDDEFLPSGDESTEDEDNYCVENNTEEICLQNDVNIPTSGKLTILCQTASADTRRIYDNSFAFSGRHRFRKSQNTGMPVIAKSLKWCRSLPLCRLTVGKRRRTVPLLINQLNLLLFWTPLSRTHGCLHDIHVYSYMYN